MRWVELSLDRIGDIERQASEVCRTVETLTLQRGKRRDSATDAQLRKAIAALQQSVSERIAKMAQFYRDHELDPRALKLEEIRLQLKRTLLKCQNTEEPTPQVEASRERGTQGAVNSSRHDTSQSSLLARERMLIDAERVDSSITAPTLHHSAFASYDPRREEAPPKEEKQLPEVTRQPPPAPVVVKEPPQVVPGKVLLRIVMTAEDFEEVKARRAAMKELLSEQKGHRGRAAASPIRGSADKRLFL